MRHKGTTFILRRAHNFCNMTTYPGGVLIFSLICLYLLCVCAISCHHRVLVVMSGVSFQSPSSVSIARRNAEILNGTVCDYGGTSADASKSRSDRKRRGGGDVVIGAPLPPPSRPPLHCIISVIDVELPINVSDWKAALGCDISLYTDAEYVDSLKTIAPLLVRAGNFSHVLVLSEGMALDTTFDLSRFCAIMSRNGLSVASPAVSHATSFPALKAHAVRQPLYNIGHLSTVFELRSAVFTAAAWNVFHNFLSPYFNLQTQVYGTYFFHYARGRDPGFKMGVIRSMIAAQQHKRKLRRMDKRNLAALATNAREDQLQRDLSNTTTTTTTRTTNGISTSTSITSSPLLLIDKKTFAAMSYHDLVLWNVLNTSDCIAVAPDCAYRLYEAYKNKHDYGQDWVEWMRDHGGEAMTPGDIMGPDDGSSTSSSSSGGGSISAIAGQGRGDSPLVARRELALVE